MIKRLNLRRHETEEGTEIQTKCIRKHFNEIIEQFLNIEKYRTSKYRKPPSRMDQKRNSTCHIILKMSSGDQRKNIESWKNTENANLQR
jgi:hypothetical protein